MAVTLVLAVSVLLQFSAAGLALRLIRVTKRRAAWALIATAVFLMAVRRSITLFRLLSGDLTQPPDLTAELVALVISVLMVAGIARIAPLFHAVRQSEEALQESEEKFRGLVEGLSEALYRMSVPDGKYEYFSPAAQLVFGYSAEDFVHIPFLIRRIIHPDFVGYFQEKWVDLVEGAVAPTYEYKIIDPQGNERWIMQSNVGVFDTQGNIIAIEGICRNITERRQAEAALRESEERYRTLFERVPVGLYRSRPDGQNLDANAALVEMLGFPDQETALMVNAIEGYANPKDRARWQTLMEREGVVRGFEAQWRRRDGTVFWGKESTRVVRDDQGQVLYYEGTLEDITEHKRAEEELRHKATLLENVSEAIITTDLDFTIQSWNSAAEALYGWPAKEVIGLPMGQVIPTEYPNDQREAVLAQFQAEGVWQGETIQKHRDGRDIYILASVTLIRDDAGRPLSVLAINRDITKRKLAENALREERDFAESLLNTAQVNILVLDVEGRIVRFNPYMEELSGYSLAEVQGQDWFSTFLPAQDCTMIRALFQEAIGDIQTRGNVNPIVTKDGSERQIEWYDKTLKDADGNVVGLLAVGQDITERKRAEEELREYRAHLEELVEARTAELKQMVDLMAGREVRMAELKEVIQKLHAQLEAAGLEPAADDPLAPWMEEES